jgi:hypothetical protein
MKNKIFILAVLMSVILIFNSCIGISMDIQMNRDGSGRLTLEYRISRLLYNIGTLDGNELMPTIPVGRVDWERTIDRIPGTSLASFSRQETASDIIFIVSINYSNTDALINLLAFHGNIASISHNDLSTSFNIIIFNNPDAEYDDNLMELMQGVFSNYNFSLSFSASGNSTMTITDGSKNPIAALPSSIIVPEGRRVSFTMNIIDIIDLSDGLGVIISW